MDNIMHMCIDYKNTPWLNVTTQINSDSRSSTDVCSGTNDSSTSWLSLSVCVCMLKIFHRAFFH